MTTKEVVRPLKTESRKEGEHGPRQVVVCGVCGLCRLFQAFTKNLVFRGVKNAVVLVQCPKEFHTFIF